MNPVNPATSTILNPDVSKRCELYYSAIQLHLSGPAHWDKAKECYERTLACGFDEQKLASKFLGWITGGLRIIVPIELTHADSVKSARRFLTSLQSTTRPQRIELIRGIELMAEYCKRQSIEISVIWHSIRMLNDVLQLGSNFNLLQKSIRNIGILHNCVDQHGIPVPAKLRNSKCGEEGFCNIQGVSFKGGTPFVLGVKADKKPPLVTKSDIDVALYLAYLAGPQPVLPTFSLDRAEDVYPCTRRVNKKTFHPVWLGQTSYGQVMYLADWLMKAHVMGGSLPSTTNPFISTYTLPSQEPTEIMRSLWNAGGDYELLDGRKADHGRLEIVLKDVKLEKTTMQNDTTCCLYAIKGVDLVVESSLVFFEHGKEHHARKNDHTTAPGSQAKLIEENYEELSAQFPAFAKVKAILALFAVFCQARRDGVVLNEKETRRLVNYFTSKIAKWKALCATKYEWSPKPYHNGGCCCAGGISARGRASCDYVVAKNGFTVPIPSGAAGPFLTRNKLGMFYDGGSGGHGFHKDVRSVAIYPEGVLHGQRAYYLNGEGQKINPYTKQTVDPSHPYAHIRPTRKT